MKLTLTSAVLAGSMLLSALAFAANTDIATVPLLNINGTGTVKPNLMLLFDNSGSMDQSYTPDYVNDNLCRGAALLSTSQVACNPGMPPFMSPDFNKQYYNPNVLYVAPIKFDGTYYPDQTAATTSNWTVASGDGFGSRKLDLFGNSSTSINLLTGFPDLQWCDSSGNNCKTNTATYTYPDNVNKYSSAISTGPYYYTIGVAEYCTDSTMTNCQSTSVGAAAPANYPVPVKVRWCSNTTLTACQGKRVGNFIYPRYSTPIGAVASYGTISIGASKASGSVAITSVTIPDPTTARTITNGTVTASTGTTTALNQQTMASALAASIIAKTGLTNQYYACVRTPIGQPTVPACASTFGITLAADNIVAVVPVTCSGSKSVLNCLPVNDNSRSGWGITVNVTPAAAVPPTALLGISGTTANSGTPTIASVSLGGVTLASNIVIGKSISASSVVSKIVTAIGTSGTVRAYVGGNSVTTTCSGKSSSYVCLVDTLATANGAAPAASALSGLTYTNTSGAGFTDTLPTTTTALSTGSSPPSTFTRVNIVSGATYPKGSARSDCVTTAGVCTYAEEMHNFANWYVYYKTRIQMMKSSIGIAFSTLNGNYQVGYFKLSNAGAGSAVDIKPAPFTGTARSNWYTALYNTTTSGSTPIRAAMDNVGRMYANLTPYNYAAGSEVVQYPCQPNFMILTTDGYWNGASTPNVVNNDNIENPARFCTAARGCVDPRAQSQPSISDVSLHWYNGGSDTSTISLRPTLEPNMNVPGLVPAGPGENTHLHMNTYTLGLGVDGIMTYEPNYDTAPIVGGDFYNLITSVQTGCPWTGGAYEWPDPDVTNTASTVQERVDDLWHAAINGHGKYFSAAQPDEVVTSLSSALANIQVRTGSASAAATSTPNITQQDNDIFSDTFTTVRWYGVLSDKKIDPTTGIVGSTEAWDTSNTVGMNVSASSDTRNIYMLDGSVTTGTPKLFQYGVMTATEQGWFSNKCSLMTQCALLSSTDKATNNSGTNLVNWLRGQQQYADGNIYRAYTLTATTPAGATGPIPIVLGDIVSSKPAYLRDPRKDYTISGYSAYKSTFAARLGTVFTAANDGMLHAFSAATGNELWAYAPRITMANLYKQADTNYGPNHQFTTDGSPELGDVQLGGKWATVLVAGLNDGGRGFYALDVTTPDPSDVQDPNNASNVPGQPRALWELCADSTVCANADPDIGLTFGNPQFGMWNGKWVVFLTSGYNNGSGVTSGPAGSGGGFLFIVDVSNGTILKKIPTGAGTAATPSGLAKITAISSNPDTDPVTTYIYGGDNNGTLWRFDLTDTSATVKTGDVIKMGDAGTSQPITTRPDVTLCAATSTVTDPATGLSSTTQIAQRVVLFGTGRLLGTTDVADTDTQSLYLLKDSGSTISNIRGSTMVQQTLSLAGSSSNINTYDITSNPVNLSTQDGWYFDWNLTANKGERMNLDPQIVSGVANVVTNIPSSSSACSVGGTSNVYAVNVCTGAAISSTNVAGSTLSNTSAAVGFIIVRLSNGDLKMITTTAAGDTITSSLSELNAVAAHKVGWRRVKDQ